MSVGEKTNNKKKPKQVCSAHILLPDAFSSSTCTVQLLEARPALHDSSKSQGFIATARVSDDT